MADTEAGTTAGSDRASPTNTSEVMLEVNDLCAGYGSKRVVFDVNLRVNRGEIVGLIGHNGAGKTTTIRAIFGTLPTQGGSVVYDGRVVTGQSPRRNVLSGMSLIPSERFVFADLSVQDNLLLGALREKSSQVVTSRLQEVQELLPVLAERAAQKAGTLSGGQQRLLSLGTALMGGPRVLFLDEPSLGIAPALVTSIFATIRRFADERGLSVLLLEQNVAQLLKIVDRVYVMRSGRIILEETVDLMRKRDHYWDLF